jgi:hypothetical protein
MRHRNVTRIAVDAGPEWVMAGEAPYVEHTNAY